MNQPEPPVGVPYNSVVPFSGTAFYPSRSIQTTFLTLELVSLTLTLILASTIAFAPTIKRHPFIITYLLLSAVYSASTVISLIPAGGYITQLPILPLAIVQSGMGFAGGTVAAYSDCLLASLMLFKILPHNTRLARFGASRGYDLFLLLSPWVLFVGISLIGMGLVIADHGKVQHQGLLCFLAIPVALKLYYQLTLALFACTTVIDLIMGFCLIRYHYERPATIPATPRQSHSLDGSLFPSPASIPTNSTPPRKNSGTLKALKAMHVRAQTRNSGLAVRVVALGCFFMVTLILHALIVARKLEAGPVYMFEANRGTIIFLIMSSQSDVYRTYLEVLQSTLLFIREAYYDTLFFLSHPISSARSLRHSLKHRTSTTSLNSTPKPKRGGSRADKSSGERSFSGSESSTLGQTESRGSLGSEIEWKKAIDELGEMTEEKERQGAGDEEAAIGGAATTLPGIMVSVEVEVHVEEAEEADSSFGQLHTII